MIFLSVTIYFLSFVNSENLKTATEFTSTVRFDPEIRVCCNATGIDCFDLNLMPENKTLDFEYEIVYGAPSCSMYYELIEDEWNFLSVRNSIF